MVGILITMVLSSGAWVPFDLKARFLKMQALVIAESDPSERCARLSYPWHKVGTLATRPSSRRNLYTRCSVVLVVRGLCGRHGVIGCS